MRIAKKFPRLHDRMTMHGFELSGSAGFLLDELNEVLCPLGFRVIEEHEVIAETLADAERFLEKIDGKQNNHNPA